VPAVLVIDHGALTYDGDLRALVHRVRPRKRVVLRTADGQVETIDVEQSELQARLAAILAQRRVADLTVEDPPLEEVDARAVRGAQGGGGRPTVAAPERAR
jgi:ABC-2 type transport system ATP-binding protein